MNAADIRTVMLKETRELGDALTGGSRTQMLAIVFVGAFFGVVSPLRDGRAWLASPTSMFSYAFIGAIFLMQPIADAFAGERERHTLETLLSTRLDDSAIVLGKLLGVLVPVWLATLLIYVVAILATNFEFRDGGLLLPPLWNVELTVAAIILVPGLLGAIGIFVSMRADTVRKAAQTLSFFVMLLVFLPLIAGTVLPKEWRRSFFQALQAHSPREVATAAAVALLVLEVAIVAAALARFRRGKLALD